MERKRLWILVVCCALALAAVSPVFAGAQDEEPVDLKALVGAWPTTGLLAEHAQSYAAEEGITVTFESVPYQELHAKMLVSLAAKEGLYDILGLNPDWAPPLLAEGFLQSLEGYLADPDVAPPGYDFDDFFDSSTQAFIYEDEVYGLPFETGAFVNYYRTDLLDEYNLDPPTTLEEYVNVARTLTLDTDNDGTIDIYGAAVPGSRQAQTAIEFVTLLWSYGGEVLDSNGRAAFNSDAGRNALQLEVDLVHNYKVTPPGILEYSYDGLAPLFLEGKLAMVTSWVHVAGMAADPAQSKVVDNFWFGPRPGIGWTGTWALVIPDDSTQKEEAFKLASFLTSKDTVGAMASQGVAGARASVMNDAALVDQYPQFGPIIEAVKNARPVFFSLQFEELFDILAVNIGEALAGSATVEEALAKAEREVNDL